MVLNMINGLKEESGNTVVVFLVFNFFNILSWP